MSWIYKSGQGYWTRMLTAIGSGVLVVAGAQWLWTKLEVLKARWEWVVFVQAGLAVAIIAVFGLLVYRWVAAKPRSCDFLIATEGEMKKVNWPGRKEVIGSTWVVICCVALLATLLFLADFVFSAFFRTIGILDV